MHMLIVTQADHALLMMLRPHADPQRELQRAIVVSSEAVPPDVVTMNSKVVYSEDTGDVYRAVSIVYPRNADASDGRISVLSPIGTALLGLSAGQSIEWDFPDASRRTLRVNAVLYQPQRKLRPIKTN
jgi:regulator of nucleoside diphosphate kinase